MFSVFQVALVSNITTGLGRSIARRLGLAGAQVIGTGSNQQKLQDVIDEYKTAGIQSLGVSLDLANAKQRKTLFDRVCFIENALLLATYWACLDSLAYTCSRHCRACAVWK